MPESYIAMNTSIGLKVFPTKFSIARDDPRYYHYEPAEPQFGDRYKSNEELTEIQRDVPDPSVLRNYDMKRSDSQMSESLQLPSPRPHHSNSMDMDSRNTSPEEEVRAKCVYEVVTTNHTKTPPSSPLDEIPPIRNEGDEQQLNEQQPHQLNDATQNMRPLETETVMEQLLKITFDGTRDLPSPTPYSCDNVDDMNIPNNQQHTVIADVHYDYANGDTSTYGNDNFYEDPDQYRQVVAEVERSVVDTYKNVLQQFVQNVDDLPYSVVVVSSSEPVYETGLKPENLVEQQPVTQHGYDQQQYHTTIEQEQNEEEQKQNQITQQDAEAQNQRADEQVNDTHEQHNGIEPEFYLSGPPSAPSTTAAVAHDEQYVPIGNGKFYFDTTELHSPELPSKKALLSQKPMEETQNDTSAATNRNEKNDVVQEKKKNSYVFSTAEFYIEETGHDHDRGK